MKLVYLLQIPVPESVWGEFIKAGPVVLLMALVIWWLARRLEKKETLLETKNEYIQQLAEKNITTLRDMQGTLDKVFDSQVQGDQQLREDFKREIVHFQISISEQIQKLIPLLKKKNETAE